jgi:hypothetical protein
MCQTDVTKCVSEGMGTKLGLPIEGGWSGMGQEKKVIYAMICDVHFIGERLYVLAYQTMIDSRLIRHSNIKTLLIGNERPPYRIDIRSNPTRQFAVRSHRIQALNKPSTHIPSPETAVGCTSRSPAQHTSFRSKGRAITERV